MESETKPLRNIKLLVITLKSNIGDGSQICGMRVAVNWFGPSELQMGRDECIGNRDKPERCAAVGSHVNYEM